MSSLNRVLLIGRLGAIPELRRLPSGEAACHLSIATNEQRLVKGTGSSHEITEWHRVNLYKRQAEVACQYLSKGDPVYIEGRLKTRKWTDKNGVERTTTEIDATEMKMLGGGRVDHRDFEDTLPTRNFPVPAAQQIIKEDEIPF